MTVKTFIVGGAVRDGLLGITAKDQDFVVVGATKEDVDQMLADGFSQVGADFPVFLHPRTGNEYALARVERKTGDGYGGFTVETENVTLEMDLSRRDLTINSMAQDVETGEIFDPFGGQHDLAQGILRHTTEAFAEDPLRVLRVARFAARYNFKVANATFEMMKQLVANNELQHLSQERVWVELEKILGEKNSTVGLRVLLEVGAIEKIFGEKAVNGARFALRDEADFDSMSVIAKFITLTGSAQFTHDDLHRLRVPSDFQKARQQFFNVGVKFANFETLSRDQKVQFMMDIGAFNNMTHFNAGFDALKFRVGDLAFSNIMHSLSVAIIRAKSVDCAALAKDCKNGDTIAARIHNARADSLRDFV